MGHCHNCGSEITLKNEEVKCDACGEIVTYPCWTCKEWFSTYDEEKQKKRKECGVCGFFYCPNCGVCGENCDKNEWHKRIKKICPELANNKIQEIIEYIEEIKITKPKKSCHNLVPISYGKGRIKSLLGRMDGFRTRDKTDKEKFNHWFNYIISEMEIGNSTTIEQLRENGTYGQEFRDAINLAICMGKIKANVRENKKGIKYILYTRIEGQPCQHLIKIQDLIITYCPKCEKKFPKGTKYCNECVYTRGGIKNAKGSSYELKVKLTNEDSCSLSRSLFKSKGDLKSGEEEGEHEGNMGSLQSWGV